MPALVLVNGPPGSGKTTIGRSLAARRPQSLRIDIDEVRNLITGWDRSEEAGRQARDLAAVMAAKHLESGHDVIVTQLIGLVSDLERFERVARLSGATFHEFVLRATRSECLQRLRDRVNVDELPRATVDEFDRLHERLQAALASRPLAVALRAADGDVDVSVAAITAALDEAPAPASSPA